MKRAILFSILAAAAAVAEPQQAQPAPAPEGAAVTTSTRLFINGREVTPPAQVPQAGETARAEGELRISSAVIAPGQAPQVRARSFRLVTGEDGTTRVVEVTDTEPQPAPEAAEAPRPEAQGEVCRRCGRNHARPVRIIRRERPVRPACAARPVRAARPVPVRAARPVRVAPVLPPPPAAAPLPPAPQPEAAAPVPAPAPQAIKVIINGTETVVPLSPDGVNITIKPL